MTKFLFVFIAIGVCNLVCGSQQQPVIKVTTGQSSLQIICEPNPPENPNFSLFQKFNKVVRNYFLKNFGPGGTKYLDDFGECANVSALHEHKEALIAEIQSIVSEYDKWFGKSIRTVRFRIHRFLGILMLLRQSPELIAPPLVIDYHKAFPKSSDRKRFDDELRELRRMKVASQKGIDLERDLKLYLLSSFGQGAQVFECLKLAGKTLADCLVRTEYNDLNLRDVLDAGKGFIVTRACSVQSIPISRNPIRIVGVGLRVGKRNDVRNTS